MKVAIFGPNLSGGAQRVGNFHVHAEGCGGDNAPGKSDMVITATSKWDVADFIYGPASGDFDGTVEENMSDFHFAPCCVCVLPDMTDANRAKEAARAAPAVVEAVPVVEVVPVVEAVPVVEVAPVPVPVPVVEVAPAPVPVPVVEAAPRLTLVKHPLDAALAALAEVEANVGKVNAGHERHFPVYVAGLRAYIEALRADLDDDNLAAKRLAE
jgi:hypothetical protein